MKHKTKTALYLLLHFPGIAIHELSHLIFCWLSGVKVVRVVFFQFKNPPGFVEHHQPRGVLQSFFISFGPFLFGSVTALALFWLDIYVGKRLFTHSLLPTLYNLLTVIFALYFAISISLNLFPSNEDAKVLLSNVNHHVLNRFNPFAVIIYPFVFLIHLFNFLKRVHIDWLYTLVLFTLAWWLVIMT